jgi:hypothetical protein
MACGCIGFTSDIRGLQQAEVEIFNDRICQLLEELGEYLSLKPHFVYARKLPGSEEIVGLTMRELCERCERELASSKSPPRPDIVVLHR